MTDFGSPTSAPGEPERTSILALLSMISSIICCIPGLSILGTLMGIGALVTIGGSNGRVGGRGMAWTGVIVGVLVTMLWGGLLIGGASGARAFMGWTNAIDPNIQAIDSSDYATARELLSPSAQTAATDEAFETFRAAIAASVGGFDSQPTSFGGWFTVFGALGENINSHQSASLSPLPVIYTFENGEAGIVLCMISKQPSGGGDPTNPFKGMIENLIVILPDGSEIKLLP